MIRMAIRGTGKPSDRSQQNTSYPSYYYLDHCTAVHSMATVWRQYGDIDCAITPPPGTTVSDEQQILVLAPAWRYRTKDRRQPLRKTLLESWSLWGIPVDALYAISSLPVASPWCGWTDMASPYTVTQIVAKCIIFDWLRIKPKKNVLRSIFTISTAMLYSPLSERCIHGGRFKSTYPTNNRKINTSDWLRVACQYAESNTHHEHILQQTKS